MIFKIYKTNKQIITREQMKKTLGQIFSGLSLIGLDAFKFISFFRGLPFYFKDYLALKRQMRNSSDFSLGEFYPRLDDRFSEGGTMKGHYFHQDLLVARKIHEANPSRHIDVGSRVDGFVAHVASFRKIEIFDIRPIESPIENILYKQADLMQLPENMIQCCDSLSTLHAIEHFGLGRYGDPIDIDGHLKAIHNLHLMLKPNGKFYFSVPVGPQRIEFNAHRVFSIAYLLKILTPQFKVDCFSYVDDNGDLHENVALTQESISSNFHCKYGCGIFELIKI
jgi:hypothetical protein